MDPVKVRAIRLVSLDALSGHVRDKLEAQASSEAALEIDWVGLLETLGFEAGERSLLLARIEDVGRTRLAKQLGSRAVERTRRAVSRKLKRLRGGVDFTAAVTILRADPSRTMLLERFASGVRVWRHR